MGDYTAATAHLDIIEDIAYRRMLDLYYRTEAPLPDSTEDIGRLIRMRDNLAAIRDILNEFFQPSELGWTHGRCEAEIAKMQDKQRKARASAEISASVRSANAKRTLSERSTDAELPTPTPTPTPTPITELNSVSGLRPSPGANAPGAAEIAPEDQKPPAKKPYPPVQFQAVADLYNEILPELPQCRLMPDSRKRALTKFWAFLFTSKDASGNLRATTTEEALEWCRVFFTFARSNDFIMGETERSGPHANWRASLDFLVSDKGITQVMEKTRAK